MDTELRWIASSQASAYHTAAALIAGRPLVDAELSAALTDPSRRLADSLADVAVDSAEFFRHLLPLSTGIHACRGLTELALVKTIGRQRQAQVVDRIYGPLSEVERAATAAKPDLTEQLALRAEPLRLQWEARGTGLLKETARLTDPTLMVPRADVILVTPAMGGGGSSHLAYNSVRIEAVLTETIEGLPEVLRLGWLLSMLNLDLPSFAEQMGWRRLRQIAPLAMLPAVLTAAETVEWGRYDEAMLCLALRGWQHDMPRTDVGDWEEKLSTLADWWQTYADGGADFPVALAALEKLLP